MNFNHTEDRRMLADMIGRFVAEQYPFETRDRIARSAAGHSPELWRQFADLGVIGALFSEADGGFGGAGFDIAVVFEALGRGLVVEPFLGCALLAGGAIAAAGNDAQKALLPELIGGTTIAAFAHGEPRAHYEMARVATRARRSADGWVLDGAKAVVLHAEQAALFVVSARTGGAEDDEAGLSLFVVPANTPGLTLRGYPLIDGGRAAEVTLRGVALGADALLGIEGEAFATIEKVIGRGVLALCAEALGAMDAAKDTTLDYLRTRKQFGVPIGSFQALQHRMADLLVEIEHARSAVINAAAALDAGAGPLPSRRAPPRGAATEGSVGAVGSAGAGPLPSRRTPPRGAATEGSVGVVRSADRLRRERALSAAKFSIGRIGTLVAEECIQLHGGIGMTWELPLAHLAKRLVMIDHQLGDEDHHLARYIALGHGA